MHCEAVSAEQHVKEFYQWYIKENSISIKNDHSKEILKYVDNCTVSILDILYKRNHFNSDYYTKSQDYWDEWLDVMVVHKEMKVDDTTSVVPITFKLPNNYQHHLLVFVRKQMDGWRIIKVAGAEDFYE